MFKVVFGVVFKIVFKVVLGVVFKIKNAFGLLLEGAYSYNTSFYENY